MTLRCNICSQNVDEKDVESHIDTQQHKESKSRLGSAHRGGSGPSIVRAWLGADEKE